MAQNNMADATTIVVEVWADLGCPWCYIGKHRLQRAVDARPDAERFEIKIRSFELNPESPQEPETVESVFIRTHGGDASVFVQAEQRARALAQREGLPFDLDRMNANTFDLHRVMHFADESGKGLGFFSQVQDRFFAGEINPWNAETLVEVAESLGLPGARVREVVSSDAYADRVRADVADGVSLGARGVPFTVFGRRLATPGALSVAAYNQALDQAVDALSTEGVNA
jgi:predicted DsbA family dithiol-disulfide isomerase